MELAESSTYIFHQKKLLLEKYLQRIRYAGMIAPNYETLRAIHVAHTLSIPFENFNPFFRLPVHLDIDSIQNKLISAKRGGYCFEHNTLFSEALREIGFDVKGLAARVLWNLPDDVVRPRGHMLVMVTVGGKPYIADTGFGGLTLPEPLEFIPGKEQATSHEVFRISEQSSEYVLEAKIKDVFRPLYKFSLSEHFLQDYEVTNYYLSTNPNSHFTYTLIAAKLTEERRFGLRNRDLSIHHRSAETEKRELRNESELKEVLLKYFGLELPQSEVVHEMLAKIFPD